MIFISTLLPETISIYFLPVTMNTSFSTLTFCLFAQVKPKHQILKLRQRFAHSKAISLSPNTRLVNYETPKQNDDDFVFPSLADWVESHSLRDINPVSNRLSIKPEISDVDKLSQILKKHRSSTDSLIEALNGCDIVATNDLIFQLLKRFSSDLVSALGVFTWAKHRTGYTCTPELYDHMIDVLGKHRKFDLMWDFVKEMRNSTGCITFVTMSKVFRRLAAAGKYDDAIEAFRGLESFGLSKGTEALSIVMDALVKEGSVEHACNVFMEFKGSIPVDSRSFNILISGYCNAEKLDVAKKTMVEMEKHGFPPDVFTYTNFIKSYSKSKDFRSVDATLTEMKKKGCKPNVITYTILMESFRKAKRFNAAMEVYAKMKSNGIVPDAVFYASLISILIALGRVKDAWNVFEDMGKHGVDRDVKTYNTMITCACIHSLEEDALKLLRRMEEDSCKPNVETYGTLLKMCCKKKRVKVLKFLLEHMHRNNVSIDLSTYALLVGRLCNSGKLELACSFFEETISKGMVPYDSMYNILTEELEKNNMTEYLEKIRKLMAQMKQQKPVPC